MDGVLYEYLFYEGDKLITGGDNYKNCEPVINMIKNVNLRSLPHKNASSVADGTSAKNR